MTEAREAELLRHIPTLGSVTEAHAFRDALRGEQMTSAVYAALLARIDILNKRGLT
jgi:hypothetical protein